ncbi:alpha-amylase (neopullulanase) SusA [Nonlabens ulvanivorans]|uniref:Alpha-amylase (Neopullulanase) SusA n=1 Tax=Nonlabens ulvanivorans TaxID=906888 RepID=A0A090WE57_NONUL|nr:alpha-amylase (neopullulanase) SusA [Nonlabens ulvanivorans]
MNKVVQILSVLFIIAFAKASLAQDIQRIEPPFWWAGMEKSEIQIMMYGEDLYNYEAISTDLNLIEIDKTENENYLFITVDTKGFEAGTYVFNLESVDGVVEVMEYELLPREKESAQRKGFDSSDAIYLIMPDRFANGDSSNDSTDDTVEKVNRDFKGGRHGGDLQGVIDHLDYLEDLGVTSLWSTPLLEDNDKRYSYHTYAQSDLYKVDPRYGSNEDYKRLGDELHKRDMKLIMDYVTNHWGRDALDDAGFTYSNLDSSI